MTQKNLAQAQTLMIEQQLQARGIADIRVLEAMGRIPRHLFVPSEDVDTAYDDTPLPIGHNQTISQPYIVAYMTEALELSPHNQAKVLEIGTGSGYQAAILSCLAAQVYTVERLNPLAEGAQAVFRQLGLNNIEVKVGDGSYGWLEHAPYDAIITTAASPDVPPPLLDQLAEGGTLIAPIGLRSLQQLVRLRRHGDNISKEHLIHVVFVPFLGEHGWHIEEYL